MKEIYLAIPDIGDSELRVTIENLFDTADRPDAIHVGVCHSIPLKDPRVINKIYNEYSSYKNIKHHFINSYRSTGVSFGRKGAAINYSGEDFYMQVDSHTMFKENWDAVCLEYYLESENKFNTNKVILSAYLPGYQYVSETERNFVYDSMPYYCYYFSNQNNDEYKKIIKSESNKTSWNENTDKYDKFKSDYSDYFINMQLHSAFGEISSEERLILSRKLAANFMFARGDLGRNYNKLFPIDTYFFEEEYLISIEAINMGYIFVHPNLNLPLGHLYSGEFNEFYPSRPMVEYNEKIYDGLRYQLFNYLNNQQNQNKIKKYCEWAGLIYPELDSISTHYIPNTI